MPYNSRSKSGAEAELLPGKWLGAKIVATVKEIPPRKKSGVDGKMFTSYTAINATVSLYHCGVLLLNETRGQLAFAKRSFASFRAGRSNMRFRYIK